MTTDPYEIKKKEIIDNILANFPNNPQLKEYLNRPCVYVEGHVDLQKPNSSTWTKNLISVRIKGQMQTIAPGTLWRLKAYTRLTAVVTDNFLLRDTTYNLFFLAPSTWAQFAMLISGNNRKSINGWDATQISFPVLNHNFWNDAKQFHKPGTKQRQVQIRPLSNNNTDIAADFEGDTLVEEEECPIPLNIPVISGTSELQKRTVDDMEQEQNQLAKKQKVQDLTVYYTEHMAKTQLSRHVRPTRKDECVNFYARWYKGKCAFCNRKLKKYKNGILSGFKAHGISKHHGAAEYRDFDNRIISCEICNGNTKEEGMKTSNALAFSLRFGYDCFIQHAKLFFLLHIGDERTQLSGWNYRDLKECYTYITQRFVFYGYGWTEQEITDAMKILNRELQQMALVQLRFELTEESNELSKRKSIVSEQNQHATDEIQILFKQRDELVAKIEALSKSQESLSRQLLELTDKMTVCNSKLDQLPEHFKEGTFPN